MGKGKPTMLACVVLSPQSGLGLGVYIDQIMTLYSLTACNDYTSTYKKIHNKNKSILKTLDDQGKENKPKDGLNKVTFQPEMSLSSGHKWATDLLSKKQV